MDTLTRHPEADKNKRRKERKCVEVDLSEDRLFLIAAVFPRVFSSGDSGGRPAFARPFLRSATGTPAVLVHAVSAVRPTVNDDTVWFPPLSQWSSAGPLEFIFGELDWNPSGSLELGVPEASPAVGNPLVQFRRSPPGSGGTEREDSFRRHSLSSHWQKRPVTSPLGSRWSHMQLPQWQLPEKRRQTQIKTNGVSQFKEHDYRLVFFWSLDFGIQTPEDGRTGGRADGASAGVLWEKMQETPVPGWNHYLTHHTSTRCPAEL
ncbi:hypothetical protein EYF80_052523 [Liparis tanakae]|uniref:Uncharacterized protein n=1 Tax=Liparis tanakae TaxID=230148 RepID=A0A4Z2F8W8_9TELE|nr:hypothetical protein EYF80_052523 [Liparis tanakae]